MSQENYPVGRPNIPWNNEEKQTWLAAQTVKRCYRSEVISKVENLKLELADILEVVQYGALSHDENRYPLYAVKTINWDKNKPTVLVTGGVHGYETSGVQGAIRFAATKLRDYISAFNIIVVPCISPWGYETINRWNPTAVDPNRSFYSQNISDKSSIDKSYAEESAKFIEFIQPFNDNILAHFDLHETTDTDNSEFRPALAARDAIEQKNWNIPDGFYGVGDTLKPEHDFQKAIIESVSKVTHVASADENSQLIGESISQFGVINYPTKALGLCAGTTDAKYVTTTEVYPDSRFVDDENCIQAQVAAVVGGLDYILRQAS